MRNAGLLVAVVAMALLRLAHTGVLWVEEAYPIAAARELLRGSALYSSIWFDKPPAFAGFYALWGAGAGLPLRLAGVFFVLFAAAVAYWAANRVSDRGALWAALLTAFYFTFDFPATAIALTPDLLSVPLHFAALAWAASSAPLAAGLAAGAAMALNTKALFFAVAAAFLLPLDRWPRLALGFVIPNAIVGALLALNGGLDDYWQQVWLWGSTYSRDTYLADPLVTGIERTASWAWFHLTLVAGAVVGLRGQRQMLRWVAVLVLSLAAAWFGLRFFPRYFFHLLPPFILLASWGLASLPPARAVCLAMLLLIPVARFGPRYVQLITNPGAPWADIAMERDSRHCAGLLRSVAAPGDRLLVWGYRPEINVLSDLPAATRFLDSQPLNGVLADRHLRQSHITFPDWAARNRAEVLASPPPAIVVDGLGPFNNALSVFGPHGFPSWTNRYRDCGRTTGTRVYCRISE